MTEKPLISINKFAGAGENGIIYNEGFYPEVDNQKSVMGEGFVTANLFNTTTTGYSDLDGVFGSITLSTIYNQNEVYNLYINSSVYQKIYSYQTIGNTINDGQIHTSSTTEYCRYPDIIETTLGNILFPHGKKIGRGVRFTATGGSTTKIIDTTRNFGTLGYVNGDTVTNLKTGIEYTITSITTTTNTNDTLNFTANGTNTTSANDECIAWEDDRFDTSITKESWQQAQTDWVKQFKQYGNQYFFTNGNYIGVISADESTVDKTYKQLPYKHQAICFSVNNSNILVSANFNGKGVLCLWDGSSNGWNNLLRLDAPIISLTEYKSGWIFVSKGVVYYTDGWQVQKMYSLNQSRPLSSSITPASHNGLVISDGYLFCANYSEDLNLINYGIYILDLNNVNNGFTLLKPMVSRANGLPFSVFVNNRFTGYPSIEIGGSGFVSYIITGNYNASYQDKSLIMSISLPEYKKISGIGLNLSRYIKYYNDDTTTDRSRIIQVSIGDGNRGLISRAQTINLGTPTTTFIINGALYKNNEVGDQIYVADRADATYSERTFITGISGKGTTSETWQTSPALSGSHGDNRELKIIRTKLLERKTVNYNDLKKEILFFSDNGGLETNKLFIEIVFFSSTNSMPLNINEIKVYGN